MTDNKTHIVELLDPDTALFQMRLQGFSYREIAKQLRCPEKKVRQKVASMIEPLSILSRGEMLMVEIARMEQLHRAHSDAALAGDYQASMVILKTAEHRAALAGLLALAAGRMDPVQLVEASQPKETSTEKIQRVPDEIAKPRLIAGKDVDAAPDDAAPDEAKSDEVAKAPNAK